MKEMESNKTRTTLYIDKTLWKTFRIICMREGVKASNKVEEHISRYVSVHSEGNPQSRMDRFTGKVTAKTCYFCQGHFAVLKRVKFVSGLVTSACDTCLERPTVQRCIRKVLGVA